MVENRKVCIVRFPNKFNLGVGGITINDLEPVYCRHNGR